MRVVPRPLFILIFVIFLALPTQAAEKLQRALVIPGGSINIASFVGMYHGLLDMGWKPDVIIATCGSAMAASLINAIDDPFEQYELVRSKAVFEYLQTVNIDRSFLPQLGLELSKAYVESTEWVEDFVWNERVPNIFADSIMNVPLPKNLPLFDQTFRSDNTRAILVAARLLFGPSGVGKHRGDSDLFQEVFFTDPETAQLLEGYHSTIASLFPESPLRDTTDTITDKPMVIAGRATISDPFLVTPIHIGTEYFSGGNVDLYPLEVARTVAHEVTMLYPRPFSYPERIVLHRIFNYEFHDRLRHVTDQYVDHWIDYSDANEFTDREWFSPKAGWIFLQSQIPDDFERYLEIVQEQYDYGFARAQESLRYAKNSKEHIRYLNRENATPKTRMEREVARFQHKTEETNVREIYGRLSTLYEEEHGQLFSINRLPGKMILDILIGAEGTNYPLFEQTADDLLSVLSHNTPQSVSYVKAKKLFQKVLADILLFYEQTPPTIKRSKVPQLIKAFSRDAHLERLPSDLFLELYKTSHALHQLAKEHDDFWMSAHISTVNMQLRIWKRRHQL